MSTLNSSVHVNVTSIFTLLVNITHAHTHTHYIIIGEHSESSPQSTPVLGQTPPLDRRNSSPSGEWSSLHKFADLVSGESFSTTANSSVNNGMVRIFLSIPTEKRDMLYPSIS